MNKELVVVVCVVMLTGGCDNISRVAVVVVDGLMSVTKLVVVVVVVDVHVVFIGVVVGIFMTVIASVGVNSIPVVVVVEIDDGIIVPAV
jgi:hypothetical protein